MDDQFDKLSDNYNTKNTTYYHNPRLEMIPFIPQGTKRILDIGCSTGSFGGNLKKLDKELEIWGIEPYPAAAEEARKVLDRVICSTFDKNMEELGQQKFDVIIFNDVLEHLVNPGSVIQDCRQYLNKNGVLIASIPNILFFPVFVKQILIKEDWEYTKEGILDNTHLRFFTRKSIIRLFQENGYKIGHIEGINAYSSIMFSILNFLMFNKFKNWRYQQYAVVTEV